jgi:tetratricopeptide (TPR) repeat protein
MALFGAGQVSFFLGRHDDALAYLSECVDIARERDDAVTRLRVLQPLGATYQALQDYAAADRCLNDAVDLARQFNDTRELAAALNSLAMLQRLLGRLDQARPLLAQAVALARELGDQETVGVGLLNLAMVDTQLGRLDSVRPALHEVATIAERSGSQPLAQSALDVGVGLAAAAQDWTRAATLHGAAQAWCDELGLRRNGVDAAFLSPWIAATRQALGDPAVQQLEAEGRDRPRQALMAGLRDWLDAPAGPGQAAAPYS